MKDCVIKIHIERLTAKFEKGTLYLYTKVLNLPPFGS